MQDLEDMKLMWQNMNERLIHLENENKSLMKRIIKSDYKSTKEKLESKYIKFIIVECVMTIFITVFLLLNPFINEKYRIVTLVYWDAFFLLEAFFDTYLLFNLKKINIYNSSLKEVAQKAANNWKLHKICILIGLPWAFGAIILFALAIDANEFTIYGMILGGIIGALIGANQLIKFRNYYKLLKFSDEE